MYRSPAFIDDVTSHADKYVHLILIATKGASMTEASVQEGTL